MKRSVAREKQGPPESREDAFMATLFGVIAWVRRHTQLVTVGAVVVVLAVAGFVYYRNYESSLEAQAAAKLRQLGMSASAMSPDTASERLRSFIASYGGTKEAHEARVLLGQTLLEQGRASEAVQAVEPTARRGAEDPSGYGALVLQAAAYEQLGRGEDALGVLRKIENTARFAFQKRKAMEDEARILSQQGRYAAADSTYRRLLASFPEDSAAQQQALYRVWMAEVQAAARDSLRPSVPSFVTAPDSANSAPSGTTAAPAGSSAAPIPGAAPAESGGSAAGDAVGQPGSSAGAQP